ncbi:MAG: type I glyceraldehyde-3-phosphate dehydrogenase [Parcubacteria group bacterium CG11_big_fil_rev_8_21_14_0_20_39_14]|nr:MAG: type I glyceraldehyde-3-phosphate dehydrogenase [Parcubacteria group bacterium CG11_big_fil_rev_8_21_14_0_20_39_14]PIS35557.1 MAG: type I glyceraldehyde-3-phosphate dehydrogenase [Parcubacteria group bacterium CG08_land_8_20_14_0_20_38_56]
MIKVAINGFGRIGRSTFRRILNSHPNLEVAAINDLTDNKTLAHLLKYDSLYGIYEKEVGFGEEFLKVDGKEFKVFAKTNPEDLPWKALRVDIVLECTGHFTELEGSKKHLKAGAKKVIISAPSKSPEIPNFVLGVNESKYNPEKDDIISMVSCTTNSLAPVVKILHKNFQILKGFMTTIHSYTNDQEILDLSHKDLRRARAAALSMIPTSTGAAKAIGKIFPELEGKLDGISVRVPTPTVSLTDLTVNVSKKTNKEEVNEAFREAAKTKELQGIFWVEDLPLVSVDFKGNSYSSILDSEFTKVYDDLIKVLAWYDNEWGYACRLAEFCEYVGRKL